MKVRHTKPYRELQKKLEDARRQAEGWRDAYLRDYDAVDAVVSFLPWEPIAKGEELQALYGNSDDYWSDEESNDS